GKPSKFKHFQVIVVVANGHNVLPRDAVMLGPAAKGVSFGASPVQNVQNAQVAVVVLRPQNRNFVEEIALTQATLTGLHQLYRTGIDGLDRIFRECLFQWGNVPDMGRVLLDPARDAAVQCVIVFQDQRVLLPVESEYSIRTELVHVMDQLARSFNGQPVSVKRLSRTGAHQSAIGADKPYGNS